MDIQLQSPETSVNSSPATASPGVVRDGMMRPPGNVVRDSQPSVYLQEFLNIQRPAYKPDGRGQESEFWLTLLSSDNIYKSVYKKDNKTPNELADNYADNARHSLKKSIVDGNLKFTVDGSPAQAFDAKNDYEIKENTTAEKVAADRLGANAGEEQIKKYAEVVVAMNGLASADADIPAGQKLKVPGQTADGGIVHYRKGTTITQWHDGTNHEVTERGQGKASYEDRANNCKVEISWDPEDKANCKVAKTYGERRIETDGNGVRAEKLPPDWGLKSKTYQDERERTVSMEFNPKDNKLQKVQVQDWKSGTTIEMTANEDGQLRGKKTNREGDMIATMAGNVLPGDKLSLYEEHKMGDLTKKTFENGVVEEWRADKLWNRRGKDDSGRLVEERYRPPGRVPPHQIFVTLNDNTDEAKRTRLGFTRTDFGEYWGESMKDGRVDKRFQLRPSGQIMFYQGQKTWSDLKDGTHIERTHIYDQRDPEKVAGYKVSQKRDGANFTITADRDGNVLKDMYTYGGLDGRTVERTRSTNGRLISGITMTERSGYKTTFDYDVVSGMFTGKRRDAEGKAIEDAVVADDKIIYTNGNGSRRVEVFDIRARDLLGKKAQAGMYDIQRGTESFQNDDESVSVKPVAPGRTDKVFDDPCFGRRVEGTTIRGEKSLVSPDRTVVHNPDGTGVRLNADMTIDRWGAADKDNAQKESLTNAEKDFLKYLKDRDSEQDIDMRDFIELHRQFITRPNGEEALSKLYTALKTLDDAKHLDDEEKKALRHDLMRDVAHPEEMDQSRSPTCNAHVIRREMAMNVPDEYVMQFARAMNDAKLPVYTAPTDGAYGSNKAAPDKEIPVDPANLKLADCTGRNLASRIFDNICIQVNAHPDYKWLATEDGLGKFVPNDPADEPKEFSGMQMGDIADVLTKLTGVKRGVVQVTSVDDLKTALEANGNSSMIVAVNASKAPFTWERPDFDYDELYTNHVVTLTNVFQDGPTRYVNYMNQWGLQQDHSTQRTAVPANVLFNNMVGLNTSWRGVRPITPPQVVSAGDPSKVYKIAAGKIVEDPKYCIKNGRVQEVVQDK